jgi:hypothetical protein
VTLTNGQPHGAPEAINSAFFDAAQHGKPTVDWLAFYHEGYQGTYDAYAKAGAKGKTPPANAAAPKAPRPTSGRSRIPTTARSPCRPTATSCR